jgi:uncharacterized protein (TIGR02996 family)
MDDDRGFVRAILSDPGDRAARLVFADWLDERGDPRGEYIRVSAAAGKRTGRAAKARLAELRRAIAPGWLPILEGTVCEPTGWVLHVGPDAGPVGTAADLRRRLGAVADRDEVALALASEEDAGGAVCQFEVFIGGDRGCAQYTEFDGEDCWRSRPLGPGESARKTRPFPAVPALRGERVTVHLDWTVPRADALLALQYHFAYFGPWRAGGGSSLAPWVAWERCSNCPLDRNFAPPKRNPFTGSPVPDT